MQRMTAGGEDNIGIFVKFNYSHVQLNHHIPTDYDTRIWREKRQQIRPRYRLITGEKIHTQFVFSH